jgi:VWFA-related protein
MVLTFVARDDHHRRVNDLKPADVQVLENGKPQAVKDCKFVTAAATAAEHREISLLVDSASSESLSLAKDFAGAGLADGAPGIEISVWDARQLNVIQPFTSSLAAVQQAIAAAGQVGATVGATAADTDTKPAEANPAVQDARWKVDNEHCRPWFAAIYALIKQQGLVSGRKEIVYFAANEDGGDVTGNQIRALASNATRAGVSIYVVEAGALSAEAEASAAQVASGAKKRAPHKDAAEKPNLLRELAERSGGTYVAARGNTPEFRHAVIEDLVSYYELTYAPEQLDISGEFRAVTVKVSRPHIVVRNPAGYFSVPAVNALDVAPFAPALLHALQTAGGRQDFPIEAQVLRFGRPEKVANAAVIVEIPLSAMHGQTESSGQVSLHFSVLSLIKSADGRVVREIDQDIPYETKSQGSGTYTFEGPALLKPGEYRAEVAVEDENSDRLSTKSVAFAIPAPPETAKAGELDIADVLVVRDAEPGAPARRDGDPLRLGGTRIIPYAAPSISVAPGGMLPVFLTMYPDRAGVMPEMELEVQRDKVQVANLPLLTSRDEAGRYRALVWLPQDTLSPGHYVLTARAIQGQQVVERSKAFDLVPPGTVTDTVEVSSARGPSAGMGGGASEESSGAMLLLDESKLITSAKKLDDAEIKRILTGARQKALDYKRDLPNFMCIAMTRRFVGKSGEQSLRPKDSITELLGYTSGTEQYETIEVNGHPQKLDRTNFTGVRASGEFGELLDAVYSEKAAAAFKMRGQRRFDGVNVYVFEYKVPRERSIYGLSTMYGHSEVFSAFRGVVFIDEKTLNTRYVSIQAEDIPAVAMYRDSTISVNYDYFAIGGRKFLLPKAASLTVRMGKREVMKNEIQFRNYRRYESKSRILP